MKIQDFKRMKESGEKISAVTCYDYWSAKIIAQTDVDCVLVGDSASMVMHGCKTTIAATVEMMVGHVQAVARGMQNKFIVADLPFLSYRKGLECAMNTVQILMQAGAHAVKLEGEKGNLELIAHIISSGVPVMGHIGLTPQSFYQLGGFRVQGKNKQSAECIAQEAFNLGKQGCFAIIIECVPSALAKTITEQSIVPTIGIGAGVEVDGQILVLHDLLGMHSMCQPRFVKNYLDGESLIRNAIKSYHSEVKNKIFPDKTHEF